MMNNENDSQRPLYGQNQGGSDPFSPRPPVDDLYAYRPDFRYYRERRISIRMILLIVFVVFVAVVWYAYPRGEERYEDVKLPLVRADATPYKMAPENPGGEVIPYQDSTVFEPLEDEKSKAPVVENILPPPEEPLNKAKLIKVPKDSPTAVPAQQTESLVKPPSLNLDVHLTDKKEELVKTIPVEKAQDKPSVVLPPVVRPSEKPAAQPVTRPVTPPSAATTTSGGYYVQLGAFRDMDAAKTEYRKAMLSYGGLIAGYPVDYQRADLAAKGVFYRVRLGPVGEGAARDLCTKIKAINAGGCIVAK